MSTVNASPDQGCMNADKTFRWVSGNRLPFGWQLMSRGDLDVYAHLNEEVSDPFQHVGASWHRAKGYRDIGYVYCHYSDGVVMRDKSIINKELFGSWLQSDSSIRCEVTNSESCAYTWYGSVESSKPEFTVSDNDEQLHFETDYSTDKTQTKQQDEADDSIALFGGILQAMLPDKLVKAVSQHSHEVFLTDNQASACFDLWKSAKKFKHSTGQDRGTALQAMKQKSTKVRSVQTCFNFMNVVSSAVDAESVSDMPELGYGDRHKATTFNPMK